MAPKFFGSFKENYIGGGGYLESIDGLRYYRSVNFSGKDKELKQALHDLIKHQRVLRYNDVWLALEDIDRWNCARNKIHDVYTGHCWTAVADRCGAGGVPEEGRCFNREHAWPKSWWGGFAVGAGAQTDLIALFPVDGYVNSRRGNIPPGPVRRDTAPGSPRHYVTRGGARIGQCAVGPANGTEALPPLPAGVHHGIVKTFSRVKGFGFIQWNGAGGRDVFLHRTDLLPAAPTEPPLKSRSKKPAASGAADNTVSARGSDPRAGDEVEFELEDRGRGPRAVRVRLVSRRRRSSSMDSSSSVDGRRSRADGKDGGAAGENEQGEQDSEAETGRSAEAAEGRWRLVGGGGRRVFCFEPPDEFKGDIARAYFYMSVRYGAGEHTCCAGAGEGAVDGAALRPWLESVLRAWHVDDPVSDKERQRIDAINARCECNQPTCGKTTSFTIIESVVISFEG